MLWPSASGVSFPVFNLAASTTLFSALINLLLIPEDSLCGGADFGNDGRDVDADVDGCDDKVDDGD